MGRLKDTRHAGKGGIAIRGVDSSGTRDAEGE